MSNKQTPKKRLANSVAQSLKMWNKTQSTAWTVGENWSNVGKEFETFVNKFLFPKLDETVLVSVALGNSFQFLAKEIDFIAQYSEEYVILDSVPSTLDLSKNEEIMLKRNYPKMATKLYGAGTVKKQKFTLNNNDVRQGFLTLGDAISYALGVYRKKISDINVTEEREMKAMLVDYANNHAKEVRTVTSQSDLAHKIAVAIMNLQNNSEKYNEANKASGGQLARYTTVTPLNKIFILTTDEIKAYLLDTKLANTFETAGIDFTDRIMSFSDLGGAWRLTEDVTVDADILSLLKSMGDYQTVEGDIIPQGSVITFDISSVASLKNKVEEVKPKSELFAMVMDIDKIKYRQQTKGMLKPPFYNGEYDEVTYWLHYYSFKAVSPFFNSIVLQGANTHGYIQ